MVYKLVLLYQRPKRCPLLYCKGNFTEEFNSRFFINTYFNSATRCLLYLKIEGCKIFIFQITIFKCRSSVLNSNKKCQMYTLLLWRITTTVYTVVIYTIETIHNSELCSELLTSWKYNTTVHYKEVGNNELISKNWKFGALCFGAHIPCTKVAVLLLQTQFIMSIFTSLYLFQYLSICFDEKVYMFTTKQHAMNWWMNDEKLWYNLGH